MATRKKKQDFQHPRPLIDYLNRVGAELLSFRKAMVKEYSKGNNYYIEKTLIKINADGTINCSRKEHAPTKEEAGAIAAAFVKIEFPTSIHATKAGYEKFLSEQKNEPEAFSPLYDRQKGGVIMVQERALLKDGSKIFIPHTFWSDGVWRRMEPDGLLPFWKPEKKNKSRIMIHEGCKAAQFVHDLCNNPARAEELERHPWGEFLSQYESWGMIGGALAPHRSDYSQIRSERPVEVIYVCDNDYPGESALQEVSKHYGGALNGIKFDKRWKISWDMADPMPETLFAKGGRYIGPALRDLVEPATRATELVLPEGGKGRPVAVLRRAFKEEWVHSITPEVFIHRDFPNRIYTAPEFNNKVAPFSDVDDTARLIKKDSASKSAVLKYDPGKVSGIFGSGDSGRYINTHVMSSVRAEKGDIKPWIDFLNGLIPIEVDRIELKRWCATLIARPEIKMLYGVLLISENQGIGKGTLGEKILAPLVGAPNVSYPSEEEIVNSNFNYWLAHKRLAVVHEIYAGHSSKAYNRLKSVITDRYITVSKKFQANYEVENWMHIFACSNSMRAIQLSSDDRRWFVPKVSEEKLPKEYWSELNRWLTDEGGLNKIKWWAEEFLKKEEPVLRGASAPSSSAKTAVIEESYSPGMTLVASIVTRAKEKVNGEACFFDTGLVTAIKNIIYEGRQSDRLERPATVRKVASQKGWFVHPEQTFADGSTHARLLCSEKNMTEKPLKELLKTVTPLEIANLAAQWFTQF